MTQFGEAISPITMEQSIPAAVSVGKSAVNAAYTLAYALLVLWAQANASRRTFPTFKWFPEIFLHSEHLT